ncbi:MAG TPA: amidohydrolase family protein, partial [Actinomycetota bacterium]|nr:amidohydrolase family protein [Actinomycetota bacterium]
MIDDPETPSAHEVRVFANGAVFTGLRQRAWVDAVAIAGRDVVGVGTPDELRDRWPTADERDLTGRTVIPGFVDAHNHFLSTGESLASIDLRYPGIASAPALLDVIRRTAAT